MGIFTFGGRMTFSRYLLSPANDPVLPGSSATLIEFVIFVTKDVIFCVNVQSINAC